MRFVSLSIKMLLVAFMLILAGCGNSTLSCTDSRIVEKVQEMAIADITIGGMMNMYLIVNPRIQAIRTQRVDENSGACFCAAEFATDKGRWAILYSAQRTEDSGEIYIKFKLP